jgi:hypothetical protein
MISTGMKVTVTSHSMRMVDMVEATVEDMASLPPTECQSTDMEAMAMRSITRKISM